MTFQTKLIVASLLMVMGMLVTAVSSPASSVQQVLLPEQEVREAVERFLSEKSAERGWEIGLRQLSLPPGIKVSKGPRSLELLAPASWDGWGPVSVALVIRVQGVIEKNLSLRLQVDARTEMATATRALPAGTVLTAEDLQMKKQELSLAGGQPVRSLYEAVGKKLRAPVRAEAPLRSNQLVSVPVIISGQLVTIVAENAGIRITVSGKARSAGGIGDLIRVQNMVSNKEMSARIIDASTVEVGF